MVYAIFITEAVPELGLVQHDVILWDDEDPDYIALHRPLAQNFKQLMPILVAQGLASSSLSADDLAWAVSGMPSDREERAACLVPRGEPDRRQADRRHLHLRLVAE